MYRVAVTSQSGVPWKAATSWQFQICFFLMGQTNHDRVPLMPGVSGGLDIPLFAQLGSEALKNGGGVSSNPLKE